MLNGSFSRRLYDRVVPSPWLAALDLFGVLVFSFATGAVGTSSKELSEDARSRLRFALKFVVFTFSSSLCAV